MGTQKRNTGYSLERFKVSYRNILLPNCFRFLAIKFIKKIENQKCALLQSFILPVRRNAVVMADAPAAILDHAAEATC